MSDLSCALFLQPYFCGQHDECQRVGSEWALKRAKQNVEKWYPLVGVLESFDQTLSLLELVLPKFFRGVKHVYEDVLESQ